MTTDWRNLDRTYGGTLRYVEDRWTYINNAGEVMRDDFGPTGVNGSDDLGDLVDHLTERLIESEARIRELEAKLAAADDSAWERSER